MRTKNFKLKSGLSTILLLIIVVVAVLGILAVAVAKNSFKKATPTESPAVALDEQVKKLQDQSSSDEVGAIEKDTSDTNLDNLDQGMDQIEKDLTGVQ